MFIGVGVSVLGNLIESGLYDAMYMILKMFELQ